MDRTVIVVPCYNEATRLSAQAFVDFARKAPAVSFVLVNDGSSDGTRQALQTMADNAPGQFRVVDKRENQGKAEAVRSGMHAAFELDPIYVGYWDADLATPLDEIPRFIAALESHPLRLVVFGARVQLLGRSIERSAHRHYLGRVFATLASNTLRLPIYDTQCGAKLFRANDATRALFAEPFLTGWTFDVELLARMMRDSRRDGSPPPLQTVYELPLERWIDVAGSRVKPRDFFRAMLELWRIRQAYLS